VLLHLSLSTADREFSLSLSSQFPNIQRNTHKEKKVRFFIRFAHGSEEIKLVFFILVPRRVVVVVVVVQSQ
jgi:hypothetical protein